MVSDLAGTPITEVYERDRGRSVVAVDRLCCGVTRRVGGPRSSARFPLL